MGAGLHARVIHLLVSFSFFSQRASGDPKLCGELRKLLDAKMSFA